MLLELRIKRQKYKALRQFDRIYRVFTVCGSCAHPDGHQEYDKTENTANGPTRGLLIKSPLVLQTLYSLCKQDFRAAK